MKRNIIFITLLFTGYFTKAAIKDSISIICVFATPYKPSNLNMILSVKDYSKDFQKSRVISTNKQKNDSTWILKVRPLEDKYYQPYELSIIGESYPIFLTNEMKELKIIIDTTTNELRPYKISTTSENEFAFGIRFTNEIFNAKESLELSKPMDSVQIIPIRSKIYTNINDLRRCFSKQIIKNRAFKSFVDNEILYYLWGKSSRLYVSAVSRKRFIDSLKIEYGKFITDSTAVYSRSATLLGLNILREKLGDSKDDNELLKSLNREVEMLPAGLYRDYLIESYFTGKTYKPDIKTDFLIKLFTYANSVIRDNDLKSSLNREYRRYINEHQKLPESILVNTELIDQSGNKVTLKYILDNLSKSGKKRVLIDFWASWCGPCKQEIIESSSFIDSLRNKKEDFEYIYFSVDIPEKYEVAKKFSAQHQTTLRSYFLIGAAQSRLYKYFTISGIPYHVLLDVKTLEFRANTVSTLRKEDFIEVINGEIKL